MGSATILDDLIEIGDNLSPGSECNPVGTLALLRQFIDIALPPIHDLLFGANVSPVQQLLQDGVDGAKGGSATPLREFRNLSQKNVAVGWPIVKGPEDEEFREPHIDEGSPVLLVFQRCGNRSSPAG